MLGKYINIFSYLYWCGPLFSRAPAGKMMCSSESSHIHRSQVNDALVYCVVLCVAASSQKVAALTVLPQPAPYLPSLFTAPAEVQLLYCQREWFKRREREGESGSKCLCGVFRSNPHCFKLQPLNGRHSPSLPPQPIFPPSIVTNRCRASLLPLNEMPVWLGVMTEEAALAVVQEKLERRDGNERKVKSSHKQQTSVVSLQPC